MAESKYYFLTELQRYLDFPFRVKEVGWLPGHCYSHKNATLKDIYICLSCNCQGSSLVEVNGILQLGKSIPDKISFSLIEPGTHYNTISPNTHDELYFRFDISSAQSVRNLVGKYKKFYFLKWPEDIMTELHNLLHQLDKPGTADKVDQLAVRLISEIIFQHIEESALEKNNSQMRIFSAANELANGKKLQQAVRDNGFSMRSFYREWSKAFDISPKEYVIRKKLEKAGKLLAETKLSNNEIAAECGFENVKYFYSWFRKKFGKTPLEYREKMRKLKHPELNF